MRTILLMLLLTIGLSLNAQTIYLQTKTTYFATSPDDMTEVPSFLKITLNFREERCVIYSKETQIIDFTYLRSYTENGFKISECYATDTNYKEIIFTICMHELNNQVVLMVSYNNMTFIYDCVVRPPF